jgi:hypothetical protein
VNIRRLFPFALFVLLLAVAVRPMIDPDVWWHLRTGETILHAGIPRQDIFSFSFPANEWVTHEWLSQVLMWAVYRLAGFSGLITFFAVVTTVTWWLVYLISDGKPYVAGMVVALAAKASQVVWGSRPQLFNLLFLAAFLFLLEKRKDRAVGVWVYLTFPAMTLAWANLHSGYLLGVVVLGTYLVGDYIERSRKTPDARTLDSGDLGRLGLATIASALAALANPNGWGLWVYPFATLTSSVQRDFIVEWFPPRPQQLIFWLALGLVTLGVFGFLKSSKRPSVTELLLFGGTAVAAFLSVRNIPILAIAATPIVCRHLVVVAQLEVLLPHEAETEETRLPTFLAGAAIGLAAIAIAGSTLINNTTTVRNRFPEAALDWIESNDLEDERIFNSYGWGGYLIWRGFPVVIDGRADVYGDAGLLLFGQTWHVEPGWEDPLDDYAIGLVLVPRASRLAGTLAETAGWEMAYEDGLARLFSRVD